jgi:hypothetical protein
VSLKRIYATLEGNILGVENRSSVTSLQRRGHFANFQFEPKPGMLYTRVRAISARVNRNFDGFNSRELKAAYRSFLGRPVFVNHTNHDHTRARGVVVASEYIERGDDKFIELLMEVDAQAFPRLASAIIRGEVDAVSMGCDVELSVCSYCNNEASSVDEFCEHILFHKGQFLDRVIDNRREAVLVYEDCKGLSFFEISYVFDPADETAMMQEVIAPRVAGIDPMGDTDIEQFLAKELIRLDTEVDTLPPNDPSTIDLMTQYHEIADQLRAISPMHPVLYSKLAYGEVVAPEEVDTLREESLCPVCNDDEFNGIHCEWCDYTTPPEQLQDPNVDKAREVDIRQDASEDAEVATDVSDNQSEQSQPEVDEDRREEKESMQNKKAQAQSPRLSQALRSRRLAEAQRRLAADEVTVENGVPENAPSVVPTLTTDQVSNEEPSAAVENLDQSIPVDVVSPDDTEDVQDLSGAPTNREVAARKRRARVRRRAGDAEVGTEPEADEVAEMAAPVDRVDVTEPIDTHSAEGEAQQYDADEFDNNAGSTVADPDESTDQNFTPKASAFKAMTLAEAYVEFGLVSPNERMSLFASFERKSARDVEIELNLLTRVRSAARKTASSARPRGIAPRSARKTASPALGRQAGRQVTSTGSIPDSLMLL